MAEWWSSGSSEDLPEIAPCDVLESSAERAAIEYATTAHREIAPEDPRVVVEVSVFVPELDDRVAYRVTSERVFRGTAEVRRG